MMKKAIYSMFKDYSQPFKLRWGRVFHGGPQSIEAALTEEAKKHACSLQRSGTDFLWVGRSGKAEAMFRFVPDPSDISSVQSVYQKIKKLGVPITFVVVHQTPDGSGNYDIFRLSEDSYLEHHNRARYRTK
jgi:hypothetical protein